MKEGRRRRRTGGVWLLTLRVWKTVREGRCDLIAPRASLPASGQLATIMRKCPLFNQVYSFHLPMDSLFLSNVHLILVKWCLNCPKRGEFHLGKLVPEWNSRSNKFELWRFPKLCRGEAGVMPRRSVIIRSSALTHTEVPGIVATTLKNWGLRVGPSTSEQYPLCVRFQVWRDETIP
jgi:hypothetical protein